MALLVGTDYLFSYRARPENLFPGKLRTEYQFSTATNFSKSPPPQKKGEGWVVRELRRGGRRFADYLHIILCFYLLECFDIDLF